MLNSPFVEGEIFVEEENFPKIKDHLSEDVPGIEVKEQEVESNLYKVRIIIFIL
jgi:hypothetical protein